VPLLGIRGASRETRLSLESGVFTKQEVSMRIKRAIRVCVAVLACASMRALAQDGVQTPQSAGVSPVMFSLIAPAQVPGPDWDVYGLRINVIYGVCRDLYGLDVGLVNHVKGTTKALQVGAIANISDGPAMWFQAGLVNTAGSTLNGLQIGAVNYAERASVLQIGGFNGADHVDGLQIGVINVTRTMIGLQIGVVNVIQDNDIPFVPVINFYF
jgi:hypothetical protein